MRLTLLLALARVNILRPCVFWPPGSLIISFSAWTGFLVSELAAWFTFVLGHKVLLGFSSYSMSSPQAVVQVGEDLNFANRPSLLFSFVENFVETL
jgi:hypothetical protein